jgi:hypothetical protein
MGALVRHPGLVEPIVGLKATLGHHGLMDAQALLEVGGFAYHGSSVDGSFDAGFGNGFACEQEL